MLESGFGDQRGRRFKSSLPDQCFRGPATGAYSGSVSRAALSMELLDRASAAELGQGDRGAQERIQSALMERLCREAAVRRDSGFCRHSFVWPNRCAFAEGHICSAGLSPFSAYEKHTSQENLTLRQKLLALHAKRSRPRLSALLLFCPSSNQPAPLVRQKTARPFRLGTSTSISFRGLCFSL